MKPRSLSLVYFSPTGSTRRTVTAIGAGTGLPARDFDLTLPAARHGQYQFASDELVVLAMPVYGGRLPRISGEFFSGLQADKTPAVSVVVYGNRHYDDALMEMGRLAEEKGFITVAGGAFVGEHSFTAKVGAGRPDTDDLHDAEDFGDRVVARLIGTDASQAAERLKLPGSFPYTKPIPPPRAAPVVDDTCIDCGSCAATCPTGAIDAEDPRLTDDALCISCCLCVKNCPCGSRHMDDEHIRAVVQRLETNFVERRAPELFGV